MCNEWVSEWVTVICMYIKCVFPDVCVHVWHHRAKCLNIECVTALEIPSLGLSYPNHCQWGIAWHKTYLNFIGVWWNVKRLSLDAWHCDCVLSMWLCMRMFVWCCFACVRPCLNKCNKNSKKKSKRAKKHNAVGWSAQLFAPDQHLTQPNGTHA